jgi:hypothetical protein
MYRSPLCILCSFMFALLLCSVPALSLPFGGSTGSAQKSSQRPLHLTQGQCWQQVGPFATQDTAWARWRAARSQGYAVSSGVFPCYGQQGGRGYCFNVYYPC